MNVVGEITYEDVRHAFILQASGWIRNQVRDPTPARLDPDVGGRR